MAFSFAREQAQPRRQRHQAAGQEQYDGQDDQPHQQLPVLGQHREGLFQRHHRTGAQHRPDRAANAAQDHHHQHLAGLVPGQQLRRHEAEQHRVQEAGQPGQRAGQHEGAELVAEGRVAERAHAVLVGLDADQHPPERRAQHAQQQQVHQHQRNQDEVIELVAFVQVERHPPAQPRLRPEIEIDAVRAAAERGVVEQVEGHLREGKGHHDEIDALGAQHQHADQQRRQRRGQHRRRQHQPQVGRIVLWRDQRHRVGGDAEEGGMAEADQAGEADQQVEAHREDAEHQDLGHQLDVELRADQRVGRQRGQRDELENRQRAHHHEALFNRPSGRHSSTAAITR